MTLLRILHFLRIVINVRKKEGGLRYLVAYAFERRGEEGQRRGEARKGPARVQLAYEFVVGVQVVPTCVSGGDQQGVGWERRGDGSGRGRRG